MHQPFVDRLTALLEGRGRRQYGLHEVSQLQHALQAATLAEQAGYPPAMITAALLHDIGHLIHELGEHAAAKGVNDQHEIAGYAYLSRHFGAAVTEPVRLHVAAKRYLCATAPEYPSTLSADSVLSLSLQGGPMSKAELAAFEAEPYHADAVRLRRLDEAAKVKDLQTPPLMHFLPHVIRAASVPGGHGE